MLRDIDFKKVCDVAIVIAPIIDEGEEVWKAFVVNLKADPIESVMISSEGYGKIDDKPVKTSTLRHFYEQIDGQAYQLIEIVPEQLTSLNNQFWLSFWRKGKLYDKKYVFVTESLVRDNLTLVPVLEKKGVMIM